MLILLGEIETHDCQAFVVLEVAEQLVKVVVVKLAVGSKELEHRYLSEPRNGVCKVNAVIFASESALITNSYCEKSNTSFFVL